jgi:hypothetical protein
VVRRSGTRRCGLACGGALLFALVLALVGAAGCTAYSTYKNLPVDCTVQNAYDLDNIDTEFNMTWSSSDSTTDAAPKPDLETIPGGLCGDTTALVARGGYYNDWGSLFGFYSFGNKNESTREGLSFWARAPGDSGKGLTILMDDVNSYDPYVTCPVDAGATILPPPPDSGVYCTTHCTYDAGTGGTGTVLDQNGNILSSGVLTTPPQPNQCGNDYQVQLSLTSDWRFYTIPFSQFQQTKNPNMVPNDVFTEIGSAPGTRLVTSAILNMIFRLPRNAAYELWFDRLSFYRKKAPGDGRVSGQ